MNLRLLTFYIFLSVLILGFGSLHLAQAQGTTQGMPVIIEIESLSVKEGIISGELIARNTSEGTINNVTYSFLLQEKPQSARERINGELVTVVTPGAIITGVTEKEFFSLLPGEERSKAFALPYPITLPRGEWRFRAELVSLNGSPVGGAVKKISIDGSGRFLIIDHESCRLFAGGSEFFPNDGPNLFPNERPLVSCQVENPTKEPLTVIPTFRIGEFFAFGFPQAAWQEVVGGSITFSPGESKSVLIEVPFEGKPQVYNAGLQFRDGSDIAVSPYTFFRWIIKGASARVEKVSFDQDGYSNGALAEVTLRFYPSPDLYWEEQGDENPERLDGTELINTSIHLEVSDSTGALCGKVEQALGPLENEASLITKTFLVPIERVCLDPTAHITLFEDGDILTSVDYAVRSSQDTRTALKEDKGSAALIIVLGLVLLFMAVLLLRKISKPRHPHKPHDLHHSSNHHTSQIHHIHKVKTMLFILALAGGILLVGSEVFAALQYDSPQTGMRFGVRMPGHVLQSGTTARNMGWSRSGIPPWINFGDPITLEWNIPGDPGCIASGYPGWFGSKSNADSPEIIPAPASPGPYTFDLQCGSDTYRTQIEVAPPGTMGFVLRGVFEPKGPATYSATNTAIDPSSFEWGSETEVEVTRLWSFGGTLCANDYPRQKIVTYLNGTQVDTRIIIAGAPGVQSDFDIIDVDVSSLGINTHTITSEFRGASVLKEWDLAPYEWAGKFTVTEPPACPCRPTGIYSDPDYADRCFSSPDPDIVANQNSFKCLNFATPDHLPQSQKDDISFNTYPNPLIDTITFTISSPILTADIKANGSDGPITIPFNTAATLSWTSSNTDTCAVTPCPPGQALACDDLDNGGISTGNLVTDTIYSLACGNGGSSEINQFGTRDSVEVKVGAPPSPPVADAGPSHTGLIIGVPHTHEGAAASDPDNNLTSYLWELISCPGSCPSLFGNVFGPLPPSGGSVNGPTFIPNNPGTYTLRLTVTDSDGLQDSDEVTDAAILLPMTYSLSPLGDLLVLRTGSASNIINANLVNGNPQSVTFSVTGLPVGATPSFDNSPCTPTCTTAHTVTTSNSPSGDFPITITGTPAPLSPVTYMLQVREILDVDLTAEPVVGDMRGIPPSLPVELTANLVDPEPGSFTYTYRFDCDGPGGSGGSGGSDLPPATFFSSHATERIACTFSWPGQHQATVLVNRDGALFPPSDTATIFVKPPLPGFREVPPR